MSVASFIPEVWSARLLNNLNNELVYANILNRDYEGEITQYGDTVHINKIGKITSKKYTRNTDIDDPEDLSAEDTTLVIDQADYFNMSIDDVDAAQIRADLMDEAMVEASYSLSATADGYVAGILKAGTAKTGLGDDSTPLQIDTPEKAYETLVDMKTALDKANVPKQGRWVVVPPEYEGYMLKDARFAYNTQQSNTRLENGAVAKAAGFDIYISNNVPNESSKKYKIIGSYKGSGTYADQILETKAYSPEKRFADALKGLHVYGAKVTRPECVAVATVNFGAGE